MLLKVTADLLMFSEVCYSNSKHAIIVATYFFGVTTLNKQKQHSRGVHRKRCFKNMQQIYRRTPIPKCDFNKFPKQLY